nr:unnamed protein product [Callosobruchus chinensis]
MQNSCLRLVSGIREYAATKFTDVEWLNIKQRELLHCTTRS